ncbi:flagellar hook-associated protein FlgK [Hyphococcus luteus]|uniref:Flagellar hook-associated protein 1 n=1 Tax=Hyphococcus luteus TaxID=2058213 RepID=A0A2S7K1Y0_9PROT|nr:flagellar hook-associated protein FlgK [Marinicaulis flavus]PQA86438.1 flagellar hook-associated protein FlgK [Marinicaulis flavus]
MTISQALSNATSGLTATSRRAGVTSNNIANALTEGYSRREISLAERVVSGQGAGVTVAGVTRASDPAIAYERRIADADLAYSGANADAMTRISNLLGGPEDASSLFQKYASLESSLRALAETPDSAPLQQQVVSSANDLANAFNKISSSYQKIRADADKEIGERVAGVNDALQKIEDLNNSISRGYASGADVAALEDQRQLLINKVNESIPVRELQRDHGKVDLMTPEGVFLLAGTARTVEFTSVANVSDGMQYNGGAGALSGLSVEGKDITPGGPGGQNLSSGAIAGLFNVRDTAVPEMSGALDALAFDLVGRFADPAVDATLAPGDPGVFTDNGAAADVLTITGLASRLELNAAVDPAQGGAAWRMRDGVNAATPAAAGSDITLRAMIDAMTQTRPGEAGLQSSRDLNASEGAAHLASLAGAARSHAADQEIAATALSQSLYEAEKMQTGVDTDAELQNLLVIEQAYSANARVIQTVEQMISRLMEL